MRLFVKNVPHTGGRAAPRRYSDSIPKTLILTDFFPTFQPFRIFEKFCPNQKGEGFWPTQHVVSAHAARCVCLKNTFRRRKSRFHREKSIFRSIENQTIINSRFFIIHSSTPRLTNSNRIQSAFRRGTLRAGKKCV